MKTMYSIIKNSLEFNKLKKAEIPKEMILEAKIISNYLKTKNDFWLPMLKKYNPSTIVHDFRSYWQDTRHRSFLPSIEYLFQKPKKQKPTETIHLQLKENPTIEQTPKKIKITTLKTKTPKKIKKKQ